MNTTLHAAMGVHLPIIGSITLLGGSQEDAHRTSWHVLKREFPEMRRDERATPSASALVVLDLDTWGRSDANIYAFDAMVRGPQKPVDLQLVHSPDIDVARAAIEIMTRYQGMLQRRNEASFGNAFDRVLTIHRELHDLSKPLVEADYHHALDTWQWLLRLEPRASLELQVAALFHDVERLFSEAERRVEQHAPNYETFKRAHARRGGRLVARFLHGVLSSLALRQVVRLVSRHERAEEDHQVALLNDADALSFFSLNSNGFVDYYGHEHTSKKVAYTLERLRSKERWRLQWMRLQPSVRSMVESCLCEDRGRSSGGQTEKVEGK